MGLFVVQHRHPADRCPARDPRMGAMLLEHLSPANAKQHGLTIHGEAVVNNAHTLYMIVEGPNPEAVARFMKPFTQAGTVDVLAASPCEAVVGRGGCDAG
ncbi:MAG TPA: DUF3303 family protein [bacterium]|nr:DUF3303 family protein [bacterium]